MTNDRITNEDKAEYLRNERKLRRGDRQASTMFGQAIIDMKLDAGGGRFVEKTGLDVTGTKQASAQYPRQGSDSPWSGGGADPGLEPPTGQDINFVEPVGEAFEVAASIAEQAIGEAESEAAQSLREQQPKGAMTVVRSASPPSLAEAERSDSTANAVVKTQAANSPVCVETASANPPSYPDGLDVPRRADGMPLSSHAHAPIRRKLKSWPNS